MIVLSRGGGGVTPASIADVLSVSQWGSVQATNASAMVENGYLQNITQSAGAGSSSIDGPRGKARTMLTAATAAQTAGWRSTAQHCLWEVRPRFIARIKPVSTTNMRFLVGATDAALTSAIGLATPAVAGLYFRLYTDLGHTTWQMRRGATSTGPFDEVDTGIALNSTDVLRFLVDSPATGRIRGRIYSAAATVNGPDSLVYDSGVLTDSSVVDDAEPLFVGAMHRTEEAVAKTVAYYDGYLALQGAT